MVNLRINGILSFNVAFQCKRYKGTVGPAEIRDLHASLTTDTEKGVLLLQPPFQRLQERNLQILGNNRLIRTL
ncbi:restriction endonuclease [Clostridium thailandense]|uniref:restriction endonuclease n=1 Tax=Clostridium thailandense TaxID=2794346 RepID=UPI003988EEF8